MVGHSMSWLLARGITFISRDSMKFRRATDEAIGNGQTGCEYIASLGCGPSMHDRRMKMFGDLDVSGKPMECRGNVIRRGNALCRKERNTIGTGRNLEAEIDESMI